jgi:nucleoside-diphosphate-sugar epimerase
MLGVGAQARDFTYIANAVNANLRALRASAGNVAGRVFNVACGESYSLQELFATLARLTGYRHEPVVVPRRPGDIDRSLADVGAAREAFGYEVEVGFEEGLRRTVEFCKRQEI